MVRARTRKLKNLLLQSIREHKAWEEYYQAELEKMRLQEATLRRELEDKNKQLASYAINFIQKNELIKALKANLAQLKKVLHGDPTRHLNDLNRLLDYSGQIDREWEDFKRHFEEVHKDFYKTLKEYYPDLTNSELKLCTLLKLNMNAKEASAVMGVSPDSVKKARHRLRKKLALEPDKNLVDHMISLEKNLVGQAA
jgi:DNA-binding CsgD family transcriptional regulator